MNNVGAMVGGRLRGARRERQLTQARVAKRAGVSRETVYRTERGRLPGPAVLGALCDAVGLDRNDLDLKRRETDSFAVLPDILLLRERRLACGLTLADCASAAGVSEATMSRFERGMERSRAIATFDAHGKPIALISVGLAVVLGFKDVAALNHFWKTGEP